VPAEQAVVPFPDGVSRNQVPVATAYRSTWITTSSLTLKARGHYLRYVDLLPHDVRDTILTMPAAEWAPVDVALAHYRACDALGLPESEIVAMGRDTSRRAQGAIAATLLKLTRGAGGTPWAGLAHVTRLTSRSMTGGAVAVFRLGPKDARLELAGFPLAQIPYCRVAMRGVSLSMLELYSRNAIVYEVPALCTARTLAFHLSWA
jgi:hypothetical protein